MTHAADSIAMACDLLALGYSTSEVARRTGVPRSTVREWAAGRVPRSAGAGSCAHLGDTSQRRAYAYLLGMYLGDGCLSPGPRDVYRLRIACCADYPGILAECAAAMRAVLPCRPGCRVTSDRGIELSSYSKHWLCLFPQHGPGRKHLRKIALTEWQTELAIGEFPWQLLRGLIHSDGCRFTNRVGDYRYVSYQFSNRSEDIKDIFRAAAHEVGVQVRVSGRYALSIAQRASVTKMDVQIGPKS